MKWFRKPSNAPLWQDEFSVFTADERYVNRRQFTKFLTLTSLAMFVGNLWILARSIFHRPSAFQPRVIAAIGEVPIGGVKQFAFPTARDRCLLVRVADDEYVAYSQKCTHLSCAVFYARDSNQLECPCHRGFFSIADGSVIAGPPQRPLPRVLLQEQNGKLVAVGMDGEVA